MQMEKLVIILLFALIVFGFACGFYGEHERTQAYLECIKAHPPLECERK